MSAETILVGTPPPESGAARVVVVEDVPDEPSPPSPQESRDGDDGDSQPPPPEPVDSQPEPPRSRQSDQRPEEGGEDREEEAPQESETRQSSQRQDRSEHRDYASPPAFGLIANPTKVRDYVPEGESVLLEPSLVVRAPPRERERSPHAHQLPDPAQEWSPTPPDPEEMPPPSSSMFFPDPMDEARKQRAEVNDLLSKLDVLERQGYRLPKKFTHTSDLEEMRSVHHRITSVAKADAGLKISRKLLIGATGLMEWLNHEYDPVGARLDGWSSHVMAHIHDFDSALTRIWERYADVLGETNPILELVIALAMSGVMYHFTQRMLEGERSRADTRLQDPGIRARMAAMAEERGPPAPAPAPAPAPERARPPPPPDDYADILSEMPTMVPPEEPPQDDTPGSGRRRLRSVEI